MSSEIKRIRNSFTGVDLHSFPWLLKCHRVSWFECKVAQLAPIMLNVKTCEDSFLNQPRDRQQNTHTFSCQPHRWAGVLSVNQRPFNHSWPPARLGQNYSWKQLQTLSQKIQLSTSSSNIWSHFSDIFHHVCCFSQGCFEPIRLNGFVVIVVVVDRILAEQCHKPQTHPLAIDTSAKLLFLFVCKWRVI